MGASTKLFGTDGVRGRANEHPMTAEVALSLGQAVAHVFRRPEERTRIIIGKDTRLSGYLFEDALAAGICSMGADVIQVGPMPTPGMAFLTADMRCAAGVMISASHNPYRGQRHQVLLPGRLQAARRDGGRRSRTWSRSGELADLPRRRRRDRPGDVASTRPPGATSCFLKKTFPREVSLDGVRVVLDCANGAAYRVGPTVLRELGAEVVDLGVSPNGRNINDGCGSLFPQRTAAKVRELRADVGIALDGDADRCVIDRRAWRESSTATPCSRCSRPTPIERGALRGGGIVATVMSNLGLEVALEEMGLDLVRTQVGDRYVVETMRHEGYNIGGEQSGHIIFLDHNTTGDGLITALQTLAIMRRKDRRLSELVGGFERFPQVLVNVSVGREASDRFDPGAGRGHRCGRAGARAPRTRAGPLQRHRAEGPGDGRG